MNRLRGSPHFRQSTGAPMGDRELAAAEARMREQEAHVLRLIVQGAPTQMAEDVLRQLAAAVDDIVARKRRLSGG